MKSKISCCLVGVTLLATAQTAVAQSGDRQAGFTYANQVCSECHAVRKGQRVSPHEKAPAFQVVAETRGMSEMALRVWFQSPHPSMPNLIIRDNVADDLVAYILSLKERS